MLEKDIGGRQFMQKDKIDIGFVVLHYMTEDVTYRAVETLLSKVDTQFYRIIIVDNGSEDGSGQRIAEKYRNFEKIIVILNSENIGFARGNNLGFRYIKENYHSKYIILMNNDVYLWSGAIYNELEKEYSISQFAVLGPLIMTKNGRCDINPVSSFKNYRDILKYYKTIKKVYWLQQKHLFGFYKVLSKCKDNLLRKNRNTLKEYTSKSYNVQLHGCFLVFSEKYIKKFDGLDERTFLYMEEDILYKHVMDCNMTTVYDPEIVVFHEEDVATNARTDTRKIKFKYRHTINSCKVLIDLYNKNRE